MNLSAIARIFTHIDVTTNAEDEDLGGLFQYLHNIGATLVCYKVTRRVVKLPNFLASRWKHRHTHLTIGFSYTLKLRVALKDTVAWAGSGI